MWKAGLGIGAMVLAAFAFPALAAKGGHPGGGGGGGRHGGGAPHFSGGARSAVHFARPSGGGRFARSARVSHSRASVSRASVRSSDRSARIRVSRSARFSRESRRSQYVGRRNFGRDTGRTGLATANSRALSRASLHTTSLFHPFARHGFRHGHIGFFGPLFWPFAYGDFFYYALWPYAYDDPFWDYGYDDIYGAMLAPGGYDGYAYPPGMSPRANRGPVYTETTRAAVTKRLAGACAQEAAEVTGWPIDQIQQVVQPNDAQRAALDDLGNATVKASEAIKAGCPSTVQFTPSGRLDDIAKRVDALIQAVDIVQPPLRNFYESLNDDQKARFNEMGAPEGNASALAPSCGGQIPTWPTDTIVRAVRPDDTQRANLDALQSASARAADTIKASCPSETAATPPARLAAVAKRLQAMRQAVDIVRPAMESFYSALDDDQKARFNAIGSHLPKPKA
jgi:hypothetical protein